jgi:putative membrane protein
VELLAETILLRPYVFLFLAGFLAASILDLGGRRTLLFGTLASSVAWLAEFSSTRTGIPFGVYHYTAATRGQEIFIADVPMMDPLSFAFLTYGAFCLARAVLAVRAASRATLGILSGTLMMLLDVVIDPLAVRGDRWFLGRVFFYQDGGAYFGVPLSNFVGWVVVGTLAVATYTAVTADHDLYRSLASPGIALYYAVLTFNLAMTAWIGEWGLVGFGVGIHAATGFALWCLSRTTGRHRPVLRHRLRGGLLTPR